MRKRSRHRRLKMDLIKALATDNKVEAMTIKDLIANGDEDIKLTHYIGGHDGPHRYYKNDKEISEEDYSILMEEAKRNNPIIKFNVKLVSESDPERINFFYSESVSQGPKQEIHPTPETEIQVFTIGDQKIIF